MRNNIKRRFPNGISISSNNYSTSSRQKIRGIKKLAPNYILCSMGAVLPLNFIGDSI